MALHCAAGKPPILAGMTEQPDPLPYGLEHIEAIADRLHTVLLELQDVNRANYPPGAWHPGRLQWQIVQAIDGLLDAELPLLQAIQDIKTEQRRRLRRQT